MWLWNFLVAIVVLLSLTVNHFLDTPVPEPIPEKWKVKVIDASIRTFDHIMSLLTSLGVTYPFSPLERKLNDWFILGITTGRPWGLPPDPRLKITERKLAGVRVLMYEPAASLWETNRPVVIYIHGGGFSLLSPDCYDPLTRKLAKDSGAVVISVDYSLSPEVLHPVALDECEKVVRLVIENSEEFHLDRNRIAVVGDSAGGMLSTSLSFRLKKEISIFIPIVPFLQSLSFNTSSFIENVNYFRYSVNDPMSVIFFLNYIGKGPDYADAILNSQHTSPALKKSKYFEYIDQNKWMIKEHIRNKTLRNNLGMDYNFGSEEINDEMKEFLLDPYIAPLMAGDNMLRELPEAYIITAGYDIIRDDGIMFYKRLKHVGGKARLKNFKDGFHNALFFAQGPLELNIGRRTVEFITDIIKEKFS